MEFSLADLTDALAALAAFADKDLLALDPQENVRGQEVAALVRNLAAVPHAVLSAALAAQPREVARKEGHQSATHLTAGVAGMGLGAARDAIEAGSLLAGDDAQGGVGAHGEAGGRGEAAAPPFPLVSQALRSGQLSLEQAALLRRTLEKLDEAAAAMEAPLLEKALRLPMWDLRRACREVVTRHDPADAAAREKRQREERSLSITEDADGMVIFTAKLDPASATYARAWFDAQVKDAFNRRRKQDPAMMDTRPRWQIMADAFVMLCQHGLDCDRPTAGVKAQIVVRIPLEGLREELGERADLVLGDCDQASTSLTAATLRRLAVDAAILPVVLGGGSQVLDLGRRERFFTPRQRLVIMERDGGCAFCHAPPAWCSIHHIRWWWRDGGRTDLRDGVALCTTCHHRIHDDGWEIRVRGQQVWFTPPADVDPARTPRLGGRAALDVRAAA